MNFFIDSERFKVFDRLRAIYIILFIACFALTEIGRYIYRPWVYANGIRDFWIADTMGNHLGVMTQIFFGMSILNPGRKKALRLAAFFTTGYIVYEVAQIWLPKGTFDWKDMFGTLAGGIVAIVLLLLSHKCCPADRTGDPDEKRVKDPGGKEETI